MISEAMQRLVNYLIGVEFGSAYLYLAMSAYFDGIGLTGLAHWLRLQYQEELGHAQQLMAYLIDRNGVVAIPAIPSQPVAFGTPLEAFRQVLEHELKVTDTYRRAYELAVSARDYQTMVIVEEFLKEQIDELAQPFTIVSRLQLAGRDPAAILLMDQELGRRAG